MITLNGIKTFDDHLDLMRISKVHVISSIYTNEPILLVTPEQYHMLHFQIEALCKYMDEDYQTHGNGD